MENSQHELDGIAVALSGGGYRAAAFHLGTFRFLHSIGVLDRIRALSTISGGTIFGAAYVKSLVDGESFPDFEKRFRAFLVGTNVIAKALDGLEKSRSINGRTSKASLIRAAANVYDEHYFKGLKFADILDSDIKIKDISFNTTEFRSGNAFRFQKGENVISGNNLLRIPYESETNRNARIADIVAASSCFPSGFEPIRFPSDFAWPDSFGPEQVRKELGAKFSEEVPLMDGGVYDNQGLDSIDNIFDRAGKRCDLLLISDTDPRKDGYLETPIAKPSGFFTVRQIYIAVQAVMLLAFATLASIAYNLVSTGIEGSWFSLIFLNLIPLAFAALVFFGILLAKARISEALEEAEKSMEIRLWENLSGLRIGDAVEFAISRIRSLIAMSSSVFMKRIRDLGYAEIYSDEDTKNITIANQIYSLSKDPAKKRFQEESWSDFVDYDLLKPSDKQKEVAEKAREYGTNLWFLDSDTENLDNLVKCGEATSCYTLLTFLLRYKKAELLPPNPRLRKIFDDALDRWKVLKGGRGA